jgi:DNA-binding NtrC family response regulator
MPTVLAIEADSVLPTLRECATVLTASIREAGDFVYSHHIDCVVAAIDIPGEDALRFLEGLRRYHTDIPIIMLTVANHPLQTIAVDQGVYSFIDLPSDPGKIREALLSAIAHRQNILEHRRLRQRLSYHGSGVISPAIRQTLVTLAGLREPCLIIGEQGTEKEAVAYELYKILHCTGAYIKKIIRSENELEDVTFLYEAHHGCLVLDIRDDPAIRRRLLLLLDNPIQVQIIVLADPSFTRQADKLSELKTVYVLPLRDRIKELRPIIDEYLKRMNAAQNISVRGIEDDALLMLSRYSWPGNMTELAAVIYAMATKRKEGVMTLNDIPLKLMDDEVSRTTLVS